MSKPLAPAKVRLVQVARRSLNLAEDDYRSLLMRAGGVTSCTKLSDAGFRDLMDLFAYLGFQSTKAAANYGRRPGFASSGQVATIRQLWEDYTEGDGEKSGLDKWLDRTFSVSALRFLPAEKGPKAIAALRAMISRRQAAHRDQHAA